MAVYKDARVTFRGTNISAFVRAAALELGAEAQDATTMGDEWRENEGGLKTAALELELKWAAGSTTGVDSLFGSTSGLGQEGAVTIRPTTAAISASNPEYSGNFVVTGFTPLQGSVGDHLMSNASLVLGAGGLKRAIST